MASARYQSAWGNGDDFSGERPRLEGDEFCTVAWREWLSAMVVVEMARTETRVLWH